MMKTFNLHFTDSCNFQCKHCFVNKQGKELSIDNIQKIVDKIADYSKEKNIKVRINLAGGEPLISKNIQPIIDYIYSNGIEVSIITNGFYLTKKFIEKNQNKVSMIGISVDSLIDEKKMQIGRCEKNKTLTEKEIIEKCSLIKSYGIKLKINICISSLNKNEDFHSFLQKVQADRIKMLRVLGNYFKDLEDILLSDEEWEDIQLRYKDIETVFEDNNDMMENYIIIDSEGNLSKDNCHLKDNSLLNKSLEECLKALEG